MGNPTFWRLRWEEKRCRLVVQVCLQLKILSVLQQLLVGCLKQIQQLLVGCFKQLCDRRGARSHPTPSSAGHPLVAGAVSPGGSPKPAASPLLSHQFSPRSSRATMRKANRCVKTQNLAPCHRLENPPCFLNKTFSRLGTQHTAPCPVHLCRVI